MSERFKVAHVRERGQQMIFVFVNQKLDDDQIAILQACAMSAGLAGTVVAVSRSGGRGYFQGPPQWSGLFRSLTWEQVYASVNKTLTCG